MWLLNVADRFFFAEGFSWVVIEGLGEGMGKELIRGGVSEGVSEFHNFGDGIFGVFLFECFWKFWFDCRFCSGGFYFHLNRIFYYISRIKM